MAETKPRVLFVCTHNAARSQMAKALLRHYAGERFEVLSAGVAPTEVHPLTRQAQSDIGLDTRELQAKSLDLFFAKVSITYAIICVTRRRPATHACIRSRSIRSIGRLKILPGPQGPRRCACASFAGSETRLTDVCGPGLRSLRAVLMTRGEMQMIVRRLSLVVLAVMVSSSVVSSGGSRTGTDLPPGTVQLRGAGSTFAAPLYKTWLDAYQTRHPQVALSYEAIGSGEGTQQFLSGAVDFGASDAAMTDEEMAEVARGVQLVPALAGSIVLAYNWRD
jgi:predicted protein tyrosine phosphatase